MLLYVYSSNDSSSVTYNELHRPIFECLFLMHTLMHALFIACTPTHTQTQTAAEGNMVCRLANFHKMRKTLLMVLTLIYLSLPTCISNTCDMFPEPPLHLSITEDTDGGEIRLIYNFVESERPSGFFTDSDISENEDVFSAYFELDDGVLSTRGQIDRDHIAGLLLDTYNPVRFEFVVKYYILATLYRCVDVVLHIVDLDDNVPRFVPATETIMFQEDNDAVGEEKRLPTAGDDDEGSNGTSVYQLTGDTEKFELVFRNYTNTTRVHSLFLRNTSPLDHEDQPSYSLLLYAREGNDNPDEAVLTITVVVEDRCDEPPEFVTSRYISNIRENATLNSPITELMVTDGDDRTVCPLELDVTRVCGRATIQSDCVNVDSGLFVLDSEGGQMTLNGELDRESHEMYEVTVQATDSDQSSATATVEITIDDINDNVPVVTHNILGKIMEHQLPNPDSQIGHFTVSDADAGRNAQVFVHLLDNSTGEAFESETFRLTTENHILYHVILNKSLDYESQTDFHLIIHVRDNGTNPLSDNYNVTIAILDSNDNPPEFAPLPPIQPLREDSVENDHVVDVMATDLDSGTNNAHIEYELPESNEEYPCQHLFEIESNFGQISVGNRGPLDYELFTSCTILVVAKNSMAQDQLSTSITITIPLENINDNAPQITLPGTITVREDAEIGDPLGRVIATDADNLGALNYTILPSSSPFSISGDGYISLQGDLDFETMTSYTVSVEVSDGMYVSPGEVVIDVVPVNDERPYFTHEGTYYASVVEEEEIGTLVLTVFANDRDEPSQELHFSIDGGLHMERFSINDDGEILTEEVLDREDTPNYTIWIRVSDGDFFSDLTEVFIIVLDINDHTPQFIDQPYNFMIEEHSAEDAEVGTVKAVCRDEGENGEVHFEIANNSGSNGLFSIDPDSGRITANVELDLESNTFSNPIQFSVWARDNGTMPRENLTTVTVTVIDINDHPPIFDKDLYIFELREDYPIGQVFGTVRASDADGFGNNVTRHSFAEGSDSSAFHIEELTGDLSLVSSLDYETSNMSIFDIVATDDGRGDLQTSTTVRIIITNARDLNLTFPSDFTPHFSVVESIDENHTITTLEVTDNMMNSVDRLIYNLTRPDDTPSPYFHIRKVGYVAYIYTRTDTIDREAEDLDEDKVYHLKLNVSDPDTTPDSYGYIVGYLTITVLDKNDNDPMFLDPRNDFEVMENGNAGYEVASFEVADPDAGNNGTINLSLDSVVPFNVTHERSNGRQYAVIRTISPLDRESQSTHQFFLRASDQGTPTSRHKMLEINVRVLDKNDNKPIFCEQENCHFSFKVREDHAVQQEIKRVEASDADDGTNAEIRYEFVPGLLTGSRFSLNPSTGSIILIESLDCEMKKNYEFEVRAVDGGSPQLASTATVEIRVQDVNEYPPAFTNNSFTVTIREDIATGVPFTSLLARDQDCPPNADVGYTLADRSLSYIFEVNEQTGEISLNTEEYIGCGVIDYERVNEYKVEIIAYDHGSPRRFSNETLTVQITNVNEHAPKFDVPNFHILSEDAEVDSTVLEVQAYDNDTGDGLQYSLSSGTPFRWDGENNKIVLASPIAYDPSNPTITFHLHVSDGDKSNQMSITVLILNENNHEPVFETEDSTVSISENADIGTIVFSVHASDADNATNDAVKYSISAGNTDNTFYINPKEGILQVAQDLDYERVVSYTLTIEATDTGEPAKKSEPLRITVEIVNENDEEPIFEEDEYTFTLVENNMEMEQVDCVQAPDNDEGEFGDVVYNIIDEGENPGFFSINQNSGCISAMKVIDRETLPEFQLRVQAQDRANPALTDTADVTVIIGDVNDNEPTFTQPIYLFYISPDHPISESIGSVTADDPDSDNNALFDYEIVSENSEVEVSDGGVVSLTSAIPADYSTSYTIDVRVTSTVEGDSSSADATVVIIIETDTDHHPRFSQQVYEKRVSESVSEEYRIFDASEVVTDEDGTVGLTYSFVQDYEQFALDSETGLLTLQATLNYEDTRSYEILIQATDTTSRTATATLRVIVEDGNDHAPVFVQMPTDLVFSPIPYTDIELFTVEAEDDDVGDQGTVEYSIVQSSSIFAIDQETGTVTNRVNLVANDMYVFVIRAFDHGSPLKSSNITVHIRIDDQGDPPRFSDGDSSIDISVSEDKDHKADPVIQGFSTDPVAESYHLVYSNASKDMFSIDASTNQLVLNSQLDYETASQFLLIIEARSMSNGIRLSSFLLVNIIVMDANDNPPQFAPIPRQLVSETTPTERVLFTVEATDADSGQNAEITYVITQGNTGSAFEIDTMTGSVSLVEDLDREEISSYNLTIRAIDAGSPSMKNHITVFIEVTDVNDNPPIFSQGNFSISVFESPHTIIDDSIIQIVAEDADVGSLSYYLELVRGSFGRFQRDPSSDTFDIDFDTGNITVKRNLNREEIDTYTVRIEVRDPDEVHNAFANLEIKVLDINDHSPVLTLNPGGDVTIEELQPENSLVLDRLVVTDRDTGPNGVVRYSLGGNWPTGHFKINPWTGVIRIDRPIEFERDLMEFDGTVFAVDQGVPQRTASVTVSVSIQDVNNFPPVLEKTHYSFPVSIDEPIGSPIARFNYSDDRDNSFNVVTNMRIPDYYNDAFRLFEISNSENTGTLMFRRRPDADQIGKHCFRIETIQQASFPLCPQYIQATYAHVCATIHPTNHHAPMFPRPAVITRELSEGLGNGDTLHYNDLDATDADGDSVSYSLITDDIPFEIRDPSSSTITITGELDADSTGASEYTILVLASDDGFPVKSSNVTLVIHITDVNDRSPMFKQEMYSTNIDENSDIGTPVLTVVAEDVDSDSISYSIEYSNENHLPFEITSSGHIKTNATIDFEVKESYNFHVKASDGVHSTYVPVTIDVIGENEEPPVFREDVFAFTVTEDQADGSLVGRIVATDRDSGNDGRLVYRFEDEIEEKYDIFVINETSGEIFLHRSPTASTDNRKRDVEVAENFVIVRRTVTVRDNGESPKIDTAEVSITMEGITGTLGHTNTAGPNFEIIIIVVVVAVAIAIVVFVAIIAIAVLCRHHLRKRKYKIGDTHVNGGSRSGIEMGTERFCRNDNNGTSLDTKTTTKTSKLHTGNSASGSEQSYTGTADDEMDSGNERYNGHSPNLANKPRRNSSSRARSTSDLASSVGTDALHNEHPYTKAQLMRIYAANEGLLDDNVSHDSVHMFGSEGGGEADGDLDINNLIYQKINDLEDDEESTTIMDDDASTTYSKGRGTVLAGSVSNIDNIILPADDREDPLNYPDSRKGWIPPAGRPMEEAIDEITATSSFASQEEPLPRRHGYDMGAYSHSQGPSLYNPSATPESFIGIQHPPKLFHNKRLPEYSRPYYPDDHQVRMAREREQERPRYTSNRYGSASVLPEYHHRPSHRQHYRSQELGMPYPKYSPFIPGARRPVGHPQPYMTPTEGTDGTVTPQTALTGDYHYLSSSSTSLTSTNVSGNLSQPSRQPQIYN